MINYFLPQTLKPPLLAILALIIFGSCEQFYKSSLINESGEDIGLIIQYDKSVIIDAWGKHPFIPFMKQFGVSSYVTIVSLDTLNLIATYNIKENGTFDLDGGLGTKPNYEMFKSVSVITKQDTINLKEQKDFDKYFINADGNLYLWTLK